MGLDWILNTKNKNYEGPRNHRAKGLVWIFTEMGYDKSAHACYGKTQVEKTLVEKTQEDYESTLSKDQINQIQADLHTIMEGKSFPESITEVIDEEELMEHLEEARIILEEANKNGTIWADY